MILTINGIKKIRDAVISREGEPNDYEDSIETDRILEIAKSYLVPEWKRNIYLPIMRPLKIGHLSDIEMTMDVTEKVELIKGVDFI